MSKTKIIIALVAVAVLTLTIVGLATAQITANQPYTATGSNNGFWGWMGRCFGFANDQPNANPYVVPPTANSPVPTPNQGNGNYYGFGPCWARFNPTP
jgi:hypothetical protein